jgi:hypothetical protein
MIRTARYELRGRSGPLPGLRRFSNETRLAMAKQRMNPHTLARTKELDFSNPGAALSEMEQSLGDDDALD